MAKKNIEHTTFRNNALFCLHCGQSHKYVLPIAVSEFAGKVKAFNKLHADCKPTWKQPEPDLTTSTAERIKFWAEHGEHGIAAQTIWSHLAFGHTKEVKFDYEILKDVIIPPSRYSHPDDPDSFKRCYWLLKAVPEFRTRLDEMREISPVWSSFVDNWDKLTELWEDYLVNMKDNGMYDLIKKITGNT